MMKCRRCKLTAPALDGDFFLHLRSGLLNLDESRLGPFEQQFVHVRARRLRFPGGFAALAAARSSTQPSPEGRGCRPPALLPAGGRRVRG